MSRFDGRFLIAAILVASMIGMDAYFHALVPDVTAPPLTAFHSRSVTGRGET